MQLDVHQVYPGVALAVMGTDSALFGAPADAFKAVKQYCMTHNLPFPRTLVAPQALVANQVPQYNPEFFLYDFLFVYGAAFRPDLMNERLMLVLDENQVEPAVNSLRMTLMGPSYDEIASYVDPTGARSVDDGIARFLSGVSTQMAIKQGDAPRPMDTIISTITFDQANKTSIFNGELPVERTSPTSFVVGTGANKTEITIDIPPRVRPFSTLEQTSYTQYPSKFAIKPLGVRSGFDLSGPCTGFLFWINGRIVMYDGPVGTGFLLEQHGISFGDIDSVILSHCHEDHMGAFVELMLSGRRPRLYTTEVIYQSALIKLSTYLGMPMEEAARYLDYHRIEHQQPFDLLGANFKIFYTVHAIPTVGIEITMKDDTGQEHTIIVSGDTLHHEGLDKLRAENIVDSSYIDYMRQIVPDTRLDNSIYFCDTGEAIIHGHPKDYADNPNRVVYYHCPDNEYTRSFGKEVANPGRTYSLIEPRRIHPVTPVRILTALSHFGIEHPVWLSSILYGGSVRHLSEGALLRSEDAPPNDDLAVLVSGVATVRASADSDDVLATLRPGDSLSAHSLLADAFGPNVTIVAESPMELFEIEASVLSDCITRHGLEDELKRSRDHLKVLRRTPVFSQLSSAKLNRIAEIGEFVSIEPGDNLISSDSTAVLYILTEGTAEVTTAAGTTQTIEAGSDDNLIGSGDLMAPHDERGCTAKAASHIQAFKLTGQIVLDSCLYEMNLRYALDQIESSRRH